MRASELPAIEPPASVQILQSSAARGWDDMLVISERFASQPEPLINPEPLHNFHSIALHLKGDLLELWGNFAGHKERGFFWLGYLSLKPAFVPSAVSWNKSGDKAVLHLSRRTDIEQFEQAADNCANLRLVRDNNPEAG